MNGRLSEARTKLNILSEKHILQEGIACIFVVVDFVDEDAERDIKLHANNMHLSLVTCFLMKVNFELLKLKPGAVFSHLPFIVS